MFEAFGYSPQIPRKYQLRDSKKLKATVQGTLRAKGWTLAPCPPSSEWGHCGNTGRQSQRKKNLSPYLTKSMVQGHCSL